MNIIFNNYKLGVIELNPLTTIKQFKDSIKDWLVPQGIINYDIRIVFNNNTELAAIVINSNIYDDVTFESQTDLLKGGNIIISINFDKRLSDYSVDLFIKQLTYLPFKDVISLCQLNSKFHKYCTDIKYNNSWKFLIDNTFSNIPNYEDKLNKIWIDKGINIDVYNYVIYTQLINYLDPITQLMIYYKQQDMESFENKIFDKDNKENKFNNKIYRFLALFLLNKQEIIYNYLPNDDYLPFIDMLNGKEIDKENLNEMLITMVAEGNLLGVKFLQSKGADIHFDDDNALAVSSKNGHLEIVKYLIENGADIHALNDAAFNWASQNGHLNVVRYLTENGANIHANNDVALRLASMFGHLEVVRYLLDNGANIHANNNQALKLAIMNGQLEMVKYLIEKGGDIHADNNDLALKIASQKGHLEVVNYLVEKGAKVN